MRLVREHRAEHDSEWAAIESIASKIGCTAETLRKWVRRTEVDAGERAGLPTDERDRLKALERESRVEACERDPEDGLGFFCPG